MKALAFAVALLAVCASCSGSEPATVEPSTTSIPSATASAAPGAGPTQATATAPLPATPALAASPSATPTATPTLTPTLTPTAAATAADPEARLGDVSGVPFSTVDVRLAVEEGRGYSFWLVEERAPLCPGSSVPGRPYWSANLAGSDFGPVFVLWVYADVDALRLDWEAVPGEAPVPLFDCELPSGFVYWNENLVFTFDVWLSLGEPLPLAAHPESPSEMPAIDAFLELAP